MAFWDTLLDFAKSDTGKAAVVGGGSLLLNSGLFGGLTDGAVPQTGYQGGIPEYDAVREVVPGTYDPNRRPGSGGQRYFTDTQYQPKSASRAAPVSAEGLAALNAANPAQQMRRPGGPPVGIAQDVTQDVAQDDVQQLAAGGIAQLKEGKYLNGASDGMADKVPANIDGVQEARLSDGEFVIPADVVSHLGNGNSDAGAKVLKDMMSRVRKVRTGNDKQGKEIDPNKFLPV
tara:strand:+ start:79 stop:771 length:693 start_codon:yes stop_codon:yes gene_type:complete